MKYSHRTSTALAALIGLAPAALVVPTAGAATGAHPPHAHARRTVAAGETWVVSSTTRLGALTIAPGGRVVAPAGKAVTLTVDGVETGGVIESTGGAKTVLAPGTYRGDVVLTVTDANDVVWEGLTFPFRQALYVGADGPLGSRSVPAAQGHARVGATSTSHLDVRSTGENFDAYYQSGGAYTLKNPRISLRGNGRADFVGYGSAITATNGARLVVDGARITNRGVMRAGVVADGGSNVIVENSRIHTDEGTLPAGYQSTVDLAVMQQAPWMLGIVGTVRATNLLGNGTKATYIGSDISSSGWGVLSADVGQDGHLAAIDSHVHTTGDEGYGSYAIGSTTEEFLGSRLDVGTYAAVNRGGAIHYGDSTKAAVSALNTSLDLRLTPCQLQRIPVRPTVITSKRWGVMWHGAGSVAIDGGTRLDTQRASFLDKGQAVKITVDGSKGAQLHPADGTVFQLMEDDDPGPQMVGGKLLNTGVWHAPTGDPVKVAAFDTTTAHADDAVVTLTKAHIRGNLYNGLRGNNPATAQGPGLAGKNLVLTLDGTTLDGVVSATTARHAVDTITAAEYQQLGVVTNTPSPVVNNGVVVTLKDGAAWTVAGTSYLSSLTVEPGSKVTGTMTVDGVATPIEAGHTYTGAIRLAHA